MTEVFAFAPSDADYTMIDGYVISFYDTELENPYDVDDHIKKVKKSVEVVDMDDYDLQEDEHWIRIDYGSIQEGEPERIYHE